jgi:hypothetical protein
MTIRQLVLSLFCVSINLCAYDVATSQTLDLSTAKIIDLTHSFDAQTIAWPTEKTGFELKQNFKGVTKSGFFYFSNTFCSPEHSGTHLDAPMHFGERSWTSSDIPVERYVGKAVVIDISRQSNINPDYALTQEMILKNGKRVTASYPKTLLYCCALGGVRVGLIRNHIVGDDTPGDVQNFISHLIAQRLSLFWFHSVASK